MNQKAYSVLFCALLASTFAHELRAKGVAPVSSRFARGLERAASPEICQLTCTASESVNVTLGITIQVVDQVLVLANLSANAALLINASSEIVVLLNGTTGSGVALNLTSQTGVYVSSGLWLASKATIDVYIRSLSGGLQSIFAVSGAVSFSLKSVSTAILTEINLIISRLVINIGLAISQDVLVGLQIVLSISGGIIKLLNGNLRGLLALIESEISISLDIAALLNTLRGIETIIAKAYGSLEALIEAGVNLSWANLLQARNGLILLADLLLAIKISAVSSLLSSAESALQLIAQLGGNSTVGTNGLLTVLANLVALAQGSIKLETFLQVLVLFVANSNRTIQADLTVGLRESLRGLLLVIERVKGSSELSELVVIISGLVAGSWVYKSVNIGAIILKLASGVALQRSKPLQLIVSVLLHLTAIVKLNTAIAALVLLLILNLHTALGVWLLNSLGISISASGSGSPLKSLLSGAGNLILGLLTGNLYSTLAAVSGIGAIIKALKEAYEAVASGEISFVAIINRESTLKVQILALFQLVGGIRLGSSSSAVSAISVQLKELTSVSVFTGISVSSSTSISVSS
ncbi:uncharacterized protein LOC109538874 [Dendroctonus ponderosae]|uniref:Uncharacterized protein n=1 Tax=Dendroctonus ponderosae TaxID=77166 RepID=U4UCC4_DENPD|nr:uncharacterized protein LOC109538874 [Dendroctonus ponderosae]ERL90707.1 hypothetical protein D910_08054 [Dendroctonus ponderosae]KAH1008883.1 hypothetical protein HUJ05_009385 [Dendroctonus ponderosae]